MVTVLALALYFCGKDIIQPANVATRVVGIGCGPVDVEDIEVFEELNQKLVSNRLGDEKDEEGTHKTSS